MLPAQAAQRSFAVLTRLLVSIAYRYWPKQSTVDLEPGTVMRVVVEAKFVSSTLHASIPMRHTACTSLAIGNGDMQWEWQ
jgi:hypothetical protein